MAACRVCVANAGWVIPDRLFAQGLVGGVVNGRELGVKAAFKRIRLSRKFVIIIGGVLLLGGATGAAAVFVGAERLLGPSYKSVNGLSCKTVQTVAIKKNGSFWIRKFIRTEGGDGPARLRTALRVAKAIYEKRHPDLVQISVLDSNGPQLRSEMRGRAVAAQVVFIPDAAKIPEGSDGRRYSAFYYDGAASSDGFFYGLRIDLPLEDIEKVAVTLSDLADCSDPEGDALAAANGKSDGHAKPVAHGGKPSKEHGKDAVQEVSPATDGDPLIEDEQLLTSTPEQGGVSIFSLAYIKSLISGKSSAAQAQQGEPVHANDDKAPIAPPVPVQSSSHDAVAVKVEKASAEPVKP
jgi:hypothetical protein